MVPEGIYYILSGVKGDTMGRGESKKKKREGVKRISPGIIFIQGKKNIHHSEEKRRRPYRFLLKGRVMLREFEPPL